MPNIRMTIEYDGSGFHGWQRQPALRTIQVEMERVLRVLLREEIPVVHSAGRTDAGVHARGQVVNFNTSTEPDLARLKQGVSSLLRGDVAVLEVERVSDNFHARRSAVCKQYSYRMLNRAAPAVLDKGRVWHIPVHLDLAVMQAEAAAFLGTHDFTSFRAADCTQHSPVKTILESELYAEGPYLIYRVVGEGFLKQMVRIMVGTLVARGKHQHWVRPVREVIEARDRKAAAMSAPAHGLYLDWVRYRSDSEGATC